MNTTIMLELLQWAGIGLLLGALCSFCAGMLSLLQVAGADEEAIVFFIGALLSFIVAALDFTLFGAVLMVVLRGAS